MKWLVVILLLMMMTSTYAAQSYIPMDSTMILKQWTLSNEAKVFYIEFSIAGFDTVYAPIFNTEAYDSVHVEWLADSTGYGQEYNDSLCLNVDLMVLTQGGATITYPWVFKSLYVDWGGENPSSWQDQADSLGSVGMTLPLSRYVTVRFSPGDVGIANLSDGVPIYVWIAFYNRNRKQ